MPVSWTAVFRAVVVLLMAAHVFYFYLFARLDQEIVGLDFLTILASASFGLVMLVPLAWAVALPDLPVIIHTQIGRRRFAQGRCGGCGHSLLQVQGPKCPECGADRSEPTYELGWATVRRFILLAVAAWLLGCVAAESLACFDETMFVREAERHLAQSGDDEYSRPRRWPMHRRSLYYTETGGVTAYRPGVRLPQPATR